jgi:hypothetical protein
MASSIAPNIVTDGLVMYLDAANTKSYPGSGTTWNDLSGNSNNGTLINGPTFNPNGGIDFDGTDDYINFGNPTELNFTGNMSHEVWFTRNSNAIILRRGLVFLGVITLLDGRLMLEE